jgi:hypothetical protein
MKEFHRPSIPAPGEIWRLIKAPLLSSDRSAIKKARSLERKPEGWKV